MQRRLLSKLLVGLLAAILVVAGWLYLGPAGLGGSTSYAVVVGSSMEPLLDRGDLAIVRRGGSHRPGDVVLYDSEELGSKVLHRIERVEGERFVLKGDNNDFVDSERPLESQIVGELWLHVPGVGSVTGWVREPAHAALVLGLATLLALGGGSGLGRARKRRGTGERPLVPGSSRLPLDLQPLLATFGAALVLSTLLAVVSFTRPTTHDGAFADAYAHQGTFDYSAKVPASVVYPRGRLQTGAPVFLKLVSKLRVDFAYELESSLTATARGQIGLVASLTDGRGWERRFVLARERPFSGRKTSVAGTIDLRRLQTLIDRMRAATGSSEPAYSLTIRPRVSVAGRVGDVPLDTTFAPVLGFDLGDLRLQAELGAVGEGVSPLAPREAGVGTRQVANELSLAGSELSVPLARRLALLGLAASLLLGLLAHAALRPRFRGDEPARIAARYGALLLPVTARRGDARPVTDLTDMEGLVRVAEHYGRMILHVVDHGEHSYFVEHDGCVYRYHAIAPEPHASGAPPVIEQTFA